MYRSLLESIRTEVSGERALESVIALARFHRIQASPGYDEAAAWIATQLEAAGLEPTWAYVPGDGRTRALGILMPRGWDCTKAHAVIAGDGAPGIVCDAAVEPLAVIQRSAPVMGSFPLIALNDGADPRDYDGKDVRGCVVLTSGAVHRVHELAVLQRGAAGLLSCGRRLFPPVRRAEDDADALPYTSFWWSSEMTRGWGFVVSPVEGLGLRRRLAAGEQITISAEIVSTEFETRIPLLTASIPGDTDREVLIVSHLCHPRPSANDNASGAAALLETARVLESLRRSGRWTPAACGVRFLWMPELSGTCAWLALDRAHATRVTAALNLDMVGENQALCGSTLLIEDPPVFNATFAEALLGAIRHDAQEWITSYAGPGHFSLTRMAVVPYGGGSDHAVLTDPLVGVPCPMLIQWPDRYYHSSHDTPDKCDPDSLALAVRCAATYAASLAALDREGAHALLNLVGLHNRRRVVEALSRTDAARAVRAAAVAGRAAISSMSRVLDEPERVAAAMGLFDAFCEREAGLRIQMLPGLRADASPEMICPRRTVAGPLEFFTHLWPGYGDMTSEQREALGKAIDGLAGGRATLDVAWAACDGRRNLAEISSLVELETTHAVPAAAQPDTGAVSNWHDLFQMLEQMGLVSRSPDTEARWTLGT